MEKVKIILDADVLIHFSKAGKLSLLPTILPEYDHAILNATRSIGLSARLGFHLPWVGLIAIYMRAKERIFEENSKRAGVLLRGFEADLYIFKQINQYIIKSVQLY